MTQGRMISSTEAHKVGIIDRIYSGSMITEDLIDAAVALALSDEVQGTPVSERRVSNMPVKGDTSDELFKNLYEEVNKKSRGFKAPLNIFKAVQAAATCDSFGDGMQKERDLFSELLKGPQSKALQYFFFSERKSSTLPPDIKVDTPPNPIESVGIIGGGTMGCGIAISCANAGIPTTLLEVRKRFVNMNIQFHITIGYNLYLIINVRFNRCHLQRHRQLWLLLRELIKAALHTRVVNKLMSK
jgi:3-hydroxyacyl-CoA dehydrogenase